MVLWDHPTERVSDTATVNALAYLEELWRRTPAGTKSFMVTDLSRMKLGAPASQRKTAAEFMARNDGLQRLASAGGAIVVASAMVRGVITAVFWIRPPPVPPKIVSSREEGYLYGLDLLAAAAPPLPSHLLAMRERLTRIAVP